MPSSLSRLSLARLISSARAFFSSASAELSRLSNPFRILVVVAIAFVLVLILYFILEKVFIYYFARDYVQAIAEAWDLNKNLANALFWVVFAATILFVAYA